jgi:hypothetical protein
MTPIKINAFATELVKVAGKAEMLKSLVGGKDKLFKMISDHPTAAMALGGAGIGAATSDSGERLKGALIGGGLGVLGGYAGGLAGAGHRSAVLGSRFAKLRNKYPDLNEKDFMRMHKAIMGTKKTKQIMTGGVIGGTALGGLIGASHNKEAMMGAMEQPAMGTGRGVKKKKLKKTAGPRLDKIIDFLSRMGIRNTMSADMRHMSPERLKALSADSAAEMIKGLKMPKVSPPGMGTGRGIKTAQEEEPSVDDVLSEMMAQSQANHEDQPFWADQGATSQESGGDPSWGHGKGLGKAKASKPRVDPKSLPMPKRSPSRMGPKMMASR